MKLSICIPTYNRCDFLLKNLVWIAGQIQKGHHSDIEIVVADNASTDGTADRVRQFIQATPDLKIKFITHSKNLGFDRNVLSAVAGAQGEYCWLMGDDDVLNEGALEKLIQVFSDNPECVHVHVNYSRFDTSKGRVTAKRMIELKEDLFFNDPNEFYFYPLSKKSHFKLLGTNILTMSTNAFKRSAWNESLADMELYMDRNMIHIFMLPKMAWLAQKTTKKPVIGLIAEPQVQYLCMNHRPWNNDINADYSKFYYGQLESLGYSQSLLKNAREATRLESRGPSLIQPRHFKHPLRALKTLMGRLGITG